MFIVTVVQRKLWFKLAAIREFRRVTLNSVHKQSLCLIFDPDLINFGKILWVFRLYNWNYDINCNAK